MPKLAIKEELLPGASLRQRLECARDLGLSAVEFHVASLDARIDEIYDTLSEFDMRASGIHMGGIDGWLSADHGNARRRGRSAAAGA